jgi:hypothetical protein
MSDVKFLPRTGFRRRRDPSEQSPRKAESVDPSPCGEVGEIRRFALKTVSSNFCGFWKFISSSRANRFFENPGKPGSTRTALREVVNGYGCGQDARAPRGE